ncbi:hypothetical protein [Enterobacter cloacae complex sp. 2024EL-00227]|uniref:hypothetical protein n=1 Tax=Enterobacter cloacae complex sp. 2024EL-00227 TaxID=3374272 RepID=UPI003752360F
MITITKEFTKEQLQQIIETDHVQCGEASSLARIALASLEAEPVAYMYKDRLHTDARFSLHTRFGNWSQEDINEYEITEIPLYTAPPAPANAETVAWLWSHRKHPSEVSLVRPEDDERAEGAHWSGWSCQALYAAPPAPVVPEEATPENIEILASTFAPRGVTYQWDRDECNAAADSWNACRAAMLQGAENTESRCSNPQVIPDCSCRTCRHVTFTDSRFVVCPECGNKRCPHANDHRNACTGSNEPGQEGSAYPAAPQQEA